MKNASPSRSTVTASGNSIAPEWRSRPSPVSAGLVAAFGATEVGQDQVVAVAVTSLRDHDHPYAGLPPPPQPAGRSGVTPARTGRDGSHRADRTHCR